MSRDSLGALIDFLFPVYCQNCGKSDQPICANCLKLFSPARLRCVKCSRKNPLGLICHSCVGKREPDLALARYHFGGRVRELIHSFKYDDNGQLAIPFAEGLRDYFMKLKLNPKEWELVPVPLPASRRRFRGYNQSFLLAKALSRLIGAPLSDIMLRAESPFSQAKSASKEERLRNIRNVFSLKKKPARQIILIDDVITTGATVREATRLLKKSGAEKVVVLALAM